MEQISINDFSGGVVENVSPSDFSPRQWAQLKGFVPASESVMESQWSLQRCGTPTQDTGVEGLDSMLSLRRRACS